MSTVRLTGARPEAGAASVESLWTRPLKLPVAIGIALLALILYAAFEHGGVALPADARVEVGVAVVAVAAAAGWLWSRTLRISAPKGGAVGLLLLTAFACWSAVTLVWSIAPDQTRIELNRAISYVIVLCIAIAVGASHPRAV